MHLGKTLNILNIKPDTYILKIMDKISSNPPTRKLLMGCLWTLPENRRICRNQGWPEDVSFICKSRNPLFSIQYINSLIVAEECQNKIWLHVWSIVVSSAARHSGGKCWKNGRNGLLLYNQIQCIWFLTQIDFLII